MDLMTASVNRTAEPLPVVVTDEDAAAAAASPEPLLLEEARLAIVCCCCFCLFLLKFSSFNCTLPNQDAAAVA